MLKLQSFYVAKLSTSRLKRKNYSIEVTLQELRRNGEVINLGDSQLLRSLRKLKGIEFSQENLNILLEEKKKIKRKKSSQENIERLQELEREIDAMLYVPEIISIFVENTRHYSEIGQRGFLVNGIRYVRLACGAGQARRNNALFISEKYEIPLKEILNNGRNQDFELVPAKYSAYFSLATSSSIPVSDCYFAVIPDKEITRIEKVDFVEEIENGDDTVTELEKEITFNLWDGQGIITPKKAKEWAAELELDYVPSCFIIRGNFIKGMICCIDFQKYSEEVNNHWIIDVWGNRVNTRDLDLILTASQFKLWQSFGSHAEYVQNCKKNDLTFSITRVSPKKEKTSVNLNYQFIQVGNYDDASIARLCDPTIEYFKDVSKNDVEKTLLYLLGKNTEEYDEDIFEKINDNVAKALILNNQLINDPYIKNHIISGLNKRIRDSYMGNIIVDGQYTFMVSDPYAMMESIFGQSVIGLLERGQHYNQYWLDKGETKIAAMRAPLTWKSEVNILNLKDNKELREWFQYLGQAVVYNVHGNDVLLHADCDFDGDGVCLTNNKEVINSASGGLPINYMTKKAEKVKIIDGELYKSDIKGFDSRVGFVTNTATTAFALLPQFEENSPEYLETMRRLKRMRKEQGSTIDAAKGLIIRPFPKHWTKWNKVLETMSEEERNNVFFRNRIAIERRPLFLRYVYSTYNRKFLEYQKNKNISCLINFGVRLEELLKKENPTGAERDFLFQYEKYNPFLTTNCIMNRLCWYMESKIKELKYDLRKQDNDAIVKFLKNKNIETDPEILKKLYDLYKRYKSEKRNFLNMQNKDGQYYKTIEQFNKTIRQEASLISSDYSLLCNTAIDIVYIIHPNDGKHFLWNIFSEEIIENIKLNKQPRHFIPIEDESGEIEYLGKKYSMQEITVDKLEEFSIDEYL